MNQKRIKIYSLATTYPESVNSKKPKFVHVLNKELVKMGVKIKTITLHSKNSLKTELMDSVLIRRFQYLPANYELHDSSIPDEISKSKIGLIKMTIMTIVFFFFTIFLKKIK